MFCVLCHMALVEKSGLLYSVITESVLQCTSLWRCLRLMKYWGIINVSLQFLTDCFGLKNLTLKLRFTTILQEFKWFWPMKSTKSSCLGVLQSCLHLLRCFISWCLNRILSPMIFSLWYILCLHIAFKILIRASWISQVWMFICLQFIYLHHLSPSVFSQKHWLLDLSFIDDFQSCCTS